MKCSWHLCKKKLGGKATKFCSINCKRKSIVQRRRTKIKEMSVEYMGGQCNLCGYKKCVRALEFHHKNPAKKDFGFSSGCAGISWAKVKRELNKCIMLCANCHRETHEKIHSGITQLEE